LDALRHRGLIDRRGVDATAVSVSRLEPRRRSLLGRTWIAGGLAVIALLAGAWLSFVELPPGLTVVETSTGLAVETVGVGSYGWIGGLRPSMPASLDADGQLIQVEQAGVYMALPLHAPGNFGADVALGAALIAGALLLAIARLPGTAPMAGVGAAIAVAPALPFLGFPTALPLALLSASTAATALRIPDAKLQRRFDVASVALLIAIVLGAGILMARPELANWRIVWAAPVWIALGVGLTAEVLRARARLANLPKRGLRRSESLLQAAVPLAAASRLHGIEDERSRLAVDIHNKVLPRVRSSAETLRAQGMVEGAEELVFLATQLGGVVQKHQTVSLEKYGIAEALRIEVGSMKVNRTHVAFDHDGDASRPPAAVEMAAYRIGQAAIDNALRHSGGDIVEIFVSTAADRVQLFVRDNGDGIDDRAEARARQDGRMGLAQMWLRAESVGGAFDIRSHETGGTEVRFTWSA
jgi:signal transduction histidine kinase